MRLGRQFDAVFVHDAIMYMLTEGDLQRALETAFVHTRPGGAAIVSPDCFRDSFRAAQEMFGRAVAERDRELHRLQWTWDPDPSDSTYVVDYAFLLRRNPRFQET